MDETDLLTENDVDDLVRGKNRDALFAHVKNAEGIDLDRKTSTARLGARLKKWIRGDELESNAIAQQLREMEDKMTAANDRLKGAS